MLTVKKIGLTSFIALVLAVIVCFSACGKDNEPTNGAVPSDTSVRTTAEGKKEANITVIVKDKDGKAVEIRLATEKKNLADALLDAGLVSGENTSTGLYIKTVNGIRADYEKDNAYWAILDKDGNAALTGASSITVSDGDVYQLVYTAA